MGGASPPLRALPPTLPMPVKMASGSGMWRLRWWSKRASRPHTARVDIKYAPNYKACFRSAFKLYSGMTLSSCYSSATCNAVEALEAHLYACSASEGDSTHSQNRQQHPERNRPVEYRASPNLPPTACPSNDKAHHPLQTDRIGATQRRKTRTRTQRQRPAPPINRQRVRTSQDDTCPLSTPAPKCNQGTPPRRPHDPGQRLSTGVQT